MLLVIYVFFVIFEFMDVVFVSSFKVFVVVVGDDEVLMFYFGNSYYFVIIVV